MILWPCILKLEGDDELIYLNSECDFTSECIDLIVTENDYVIDSLGCIHSIETISFVSIYAFLGPPGPGTLAPGT